MFLTINSSPLLKKTWYSGKAKEFSDVFAKSRIKNLAITQTSRSNANFRISILDKNKNGYLYFYTVDEAEKVLKRKFTIEDVVLVFGIRSDNSELTIAHELYMHGIGVLEYIIEKNINNETPFLTLRNTLNNSLKRCDIVEGDGGNKDHLDFLMGKKKIMTEYFVYYIGNVYKGPYSKAQAIVMELSHVVSILNKDNVLTKVKLNNYAKEYIIKYFYTYFKEIFVNKIPNINKTLWEEYFLK